MKLQLAICYSSMFVLAVSTGIPVSAEPIVSKSLPALKTIEANLFDATEQFQAKYGLLGRFTVKKAEVDLRKAAANGSAFYRIEGAITEPGIYVFTFENKDEHGFVFEMRKVRVAVGKGRAGIDESSQKVAVSPEESAWNAYNRGMTDGRIGNQFLVNWSYYPGGEGVSGGWSLSKVDDTFIPVPIGINRDNKPVK